MRAGLVLGAVWATKKTPRPHGAEPAAQCAAARRNTSRRTLSARGRDDRVILAFGAAARAGRPDVPVDAAIVAILDETEATHG